MDDRRVTVNIHEYCICGHKRLWHTQFEGECGKKDPECDCWMYLPNANSQVVAPGHNEYGVERGFERLWIREPVQIDTDLLLAVRDEYDACVQAGSHPEWTIGGMGA